MTDTSPSTVPTRAELLERITRLAGRAVDHDTAADEDRKARDRAILEGDDVGIPHAELAVAAGITRMQVYRVVLAEHVRRRNQQPGPPPTNIETDVA